MTSEVNCQRSHNHQEIYFCIDLGVGVGKHVVVKDQLAGIGSFLLPCGSCRLNSYHQVWWQIPLPIENELSCKHSELLSYAVQESSG